MALPRVCLADVADDVRHQDLRSPYRPRAIRIIVFIQLAGYDLPATCRLVADFSKTRFDRWGRALSAAGRHDKPKDYVISSEICRAEGTGE